MNPMKIFFYKVMKRLFIKNITTGYRNIYSLAEVSPEFMLFFLIKRIPYNLRNGLNLNLTLKRTTNFGANSNSFQMHGFMIVGACYS